jgi:hypothetical protein
VEAVAGRVAGCWAPELWRFTADMLDLIVNPVVREPNFPCGMQPLSVERASGADGTRAPLRGRGSGALVGNPAGNISLVLDWDGGAYGFFTLLGHGHLLSSETAKDPVARAWARHLREHPLPPGQIALGFRRWLDADYGAEEVR